MSKSATTYRCPEDLRVWDEVEEMYIQVWDMTPGRERAIWSNRRWMASAGISCEQLPWYDLTTSPNEASKFSHEWQRSLYQTVQVDHGEEVSMRRVRHDRNCSKEVSMRISARPLHVIDGEKEEERVLVALYGVEINAHKKKLDPPGDEMEDLELRSQLLLKEVRRLHQHAEETAGLKDQQEICFKEERRKAAEMREAATRIEKEQRQFSLRLNEQRQRLEEITQRCTSMLLHMACVDQVLPTDAYGHSEADTVLSGEDDARELESVVARQVREKLQHERSRVLPRSEDGIWGTPSNPTSPMGRSPPIVRRRAVSEDEATLRKKRAETRSAEHRAGRKGCGSRPILSLTDQHSEGAQADSKRGESPRMPVDDTPGEALSMHECEVHKSGRVHRFPEDFAVLDELPLFMHLNDWAELGNPTRQWCSAAFLHHTGETLERYLESQGQMAKTVSDHLLKKCFELGTEIQIEGRKSVFEWVVQPNNRKPRRLLHVMWPLRVEQGGQEKTVHSCVFYNCDNSAMDPRTCDAPLDFHFEQNLCRRRHTFPDAFHVLDDLPVCSALLDAGLQDSLRYMWASAPWLQCLGCSLEELLRDAFQCASPTAHRELSRRLRHRVVAQRRVLSYQCTIVSPRGRRLRVLGVFRPVLVDGVGCCVLAMLLPPEPEQGCAECVKSAGLLSPVSTRPQDECVWSIVEFSAMMFHLDPQQRQDCGRALWANIAARGTYGIGWDGLGQMKTKDFLKTKQGEGVDIRRVLDTCEWDSADELERELDRLMRLQLTSDPVVFTRQKRDLVGAAGPVWHRFTWTPCKNPACGRESVLLQESDVSELMHVQTQLESSLEFKGRLLQCVSHELRTPLHAILSLSEAVANSADCHARHKTALNAVMASASRLNGMVTDILETADLMAGEVSLTRSTTSLFEVAEQACTRNRQSLRAAVELRNSVDAGCLIWGDAAKLARALSQLINNAVKFTERGAVVITSQHDGDDVVRVDVTDTGPGIPSSMHEMIWEHFVQGDMSAQREHGGTGLGLCMVRSVVEAHGGECWVTSKQFEDGGGSTFSITLPLDQCSPAGGGARHQSLSRRRQG